MKITVGKKNYELKFTFNSFKYMDDFNLAEVDEIQSKPFKMIKVLNQLMFGAMNHDRKVFYTAEQCEEVVEKYAEEGSLIELFEKLSGSLTESGFFKNLQQTQTK